MKKLIIIKYGELSTKKDNKNFFISKLKNNIEVTLENINHNTYYDFGRMFIETDNFDEVIKHLENVFGIQELLVGYTSNNLEIDDIKNDANRIYNTFKSNNKDYIELGLDVLLNDLNNKYNLVDTTIDKTNYYNLNNISILKDVVDNENSKYNIF